MTRSNCSGDCRNCGKCSRYISETEQTPTKNKPHIIPSDFCPDSHLQLTYGVAFDLGTTTVSGTLWKLENAEFSGSVSLPNYQSSYGSDVISRILFCNQSDENLLLMHKTLILCLNDILDELCIKNGISSSQITRVSFVGNSTMSHLLLNISPRSLAVAPFKPVFLDAQTLSADELGLNTHPQAELLLLPNISGHVGSDTVGMILSTRLFNLGGNHIAIDIGTNGEIVAIKNGRMFTCSTAAGPAFEGASIYNGMRAASGAIETVKFKNYDIKTKTIDDLPAIGICGSGLIDAIACLLDLKIIDSSGRMITREEASDAGMPQTLVRRLITIEQNTAFILAFKDSGNHIVLTQKDVREVQLAKSAIFAGIQTLMKILNIDTGELNSILLAGTFGNHINPANAVKISLIPSVPLEKIISVGNAAGTGASMALLSQAERLRACEIAKHVEHVELSLNTDFQQFYIDAMMF